VSDKPIAFLVQKRVKLQLRVPMSDDYAYIACDFIAGSISGAASVGVGQPFDTVKVSYFANFFC